MAITFPYNFLVDFPAWPTQFNLLWRQEQSRTAGGVTFVKDFGTPLWQTTYQSISLRPNLLDEWRARLNVLESGLNQFVAWPKSRCYPIAYPGGVDMGNVSAVKVGTINANRKAIALKGLPAGYSLRIGDYIQIGNYNLHQVSEARIASASGTTTEFEIRPHLWTMTAVNDPVALVRPSCLMTLVPGTLDTTADMSTGRGQVTFQALESR